jgi:hypothetical protein
MAYKVSGTTVINNSRGLENITSVDSATATAIGTAGGFGASGEQTFTAASAISTGDIVGLNGDGKIQPVEPLDTAGSEEDVSGMSGLTIGSSYNPDYGEIVMNHDGTRLLWVQAVQTTGTYYGSVAGYYVMGGYRNPSTGAVTWSGTATRITPRNTPTSPPILKYLPSDNNTWLLGTYNGNSPGYIYLNAIQVSSTGVTTIGSDYSIYTYNAYGNFLDVFPTGQFIVSYNANGTGYMKAGTVSGTTITFGTQYSFGIYSVIEVACFVNQNTGKFAVGFSTNSTAHMSFHIGTVSGTGGSTTLSYTTTINPSNAGFGGASSTPAHTWISDTDIGWMNPARHFSINASNVVSYVGNLTPLATPSGGYTNHYGNWGIDWDTYDFWYLFYSNDVGDYAVMKRRWGGGGSFETTMTPLGLNLDYANESTGRFFLTNYKDGIITASQMRYDPSTYTTSKANAFVVDISDFVNQSIVGVAKENISTNSTGSVAVAGGIAGGQSGLQVGKTYKIQVATGELAVELENPQFIAISSTEVLTL